MGAVFVKSSVDVINDMAINILQESIGRCVKNLTQQQIIEVRNVRGDFRAEGINMNQTANVDFQCILSSQNQAQVQEKLINNIINYAQSRNAIGVFGGDARTYLQNVFKTNIDQKTLQESLYSSAQRQGYKVANIGGSAYFVGLNLNQATNLTAKTIISNSQYADVIRDIGNKIDQQVGPTYDINNILLFGVFSLIILCIICVLCILSSAYAMTYNTY